MKFSTHAAIRGNPEFTLRAKPGPFKVEADAQGSFKVSSGRIDAGISRVPIAVRIPFLRRSTSVQVASVGPCRVRIEPIAVEFHTHGVHVSGVLAKDGMDCEVNGKMTCDMDIDLSGWIPGRITKAAVEMASEPEREDE